MKNDTLLVHISFEAVDSFMLRIPNERAPKEDSITPRICFSESMNLAISSMPLGGKALRGMLKGKPKISPILHVYYCLTRENENVRFVMPEQVQNQYHVEDGIACQEWWVLDTPKLSHSVIEVFSAEFVDRIDPYGKSMVIVNNIDYDIVKNIPENAPECIVYKELPEIADKYGLRSVLSVLDDI